MRTALAAIAAGIFFGGLAGCSGGGGGGGGTAPGGDTPVSYTGNTNPAAISESNASLLAAAATNSAGTAEITGAISGAAPGGGSQQGEGMSDVGRRIAHTARTLSAKARGEARLTSAPFDQTGPCPQGGTLRLFGDVNQFGIGTINFTFTNCGVDGDVLSGTLTMRVDRTLVGPGPNDILPTDFTLSFARLSLRGSVNLDTGGTIHDVVDVPTNTETITDNRVALNLDTGRMIKSEVTSVNTYDNVRNVTPILLTHSINGRVFDSTHGFVTIETLAVLRFATATQLFPSGGEVILTGANNRRIQVVPNSTTRVTLGLDLDGVVGFERQVRLAWTDLTGPIGSDLRDTDGDGMHNSWETAFAGTLAVNPNTADADNDPDIDGFTNAAEYLGGGNPGVNGLKPALVVGAVFPAASDIVIATSDMELPGRTAMASDGTNFLLVSCRQFGPSSGVFGVVISESGRASNSLPLANDNCPRQTAVAFDGTNYLVVLTASNSDVRGIRIDSTGVVLGSFLISSAPPGTSNIRPAVGFDGTNNLVLWVNSSGGGRIQGAIVTPTGNVSPSFPITGNALDSFEADPFVAFDGTNYIVVWTRGSSPENENVFGARVSNTGIVLDSPEIAIANLAGRQHATGVAFDGTNYLVVWDHSVTTNVFPPPDGQIFGRQVRPDGTLVDGTAGGNGIGIATGLFANHSSSIAFAGSAFVVTWAVSSFPNFPPAGIFATRVSKAGARIDGLPTDLGASISGSPRTASRFVHPVVASKGPSGLITWVNNSESSSDLKDILAASIISP